MMAAAQVGKSESLRVLLATEGAAVDQAASSDGATALSLAVAASQVRAGQMMLKIPLIRSALRHSVPPKP